MKNLVLKLLLILIVVGGCAWALYPPKEKIRLGKDLRGGASLIYSVDVGDAPNPEEIISQTIQVLQDRVNPQGVLDISMEPLGNDRIEIVMPLPTPEVLELRRKYEDTLERLLDEAQIPAGELDLALTQGRAPEFFGDDAGTERGQLIAELQQAHHELEAAREALEQARQSQDESVELPPLEQAVADAMIRFEDLRDEVLALSLDRARVMRMLAMSTDSEPRRNSTGEIVRDENGQPVMNPSPREIELANIKADFPHLANDLEHLVSAYDAYQANRTGFDDPEDLKRLLRGAGVLEFRIAARQGAEDVNVRNLRDQLNERGPDNIDSPTARWFPINDIRQWYETPEQLDFLQADPETFFAQTGFVAAEWEGEYYMLLYDLPAKKLTHEDPSSSWSIRQANRGIDQFGRPSVEFRLDPAGGQMMSRLTGPNIGEPMAIVLDAQVYSAPVLQGRIASSGQITGRFSDEDISYLIRVLAAGALEARLSEQPIAENILGPTLGEDNLRRGLEAFVIATIAVAIFMIAYYFMAGVVAVLALIANGVIIFGLMALMQGTFTLPGLAGIVLTIGMAVDANVLIYERIREEIFSGEWDLRGAIRQGYAKALSTILDANITNLIVCFVLFYTATTEVKGFALTLTLGILATLFTALFATRQIYYVFTDYLGMRNLPMLPTVIPAIHHFLEPDINWIGFRKVFWSVSGVAIIASIVLVSGRGIDLFDTELRGGVAVTMKAGFEDDGERLWLRHVGENSVESRVRSIAAEADGDVDRAAILREFANASVLTVGTTQAREDAIFAQSFQIKVPSPKGLGDDDMMTNVVVDAITGEFGDQLDVTPPLNFDGAQSSDHTSYTFAIEQDQLGLNIREPGVTYRVADFLGGVAIVLRDISPATTPADIETRIDRMRSQPDFSGVRSRTVKVVGLEFTEPSRPAEGYRSAVVLVRDPSISSLRDDFDVWDRELAQSEWELVRQALTRRTSLEQVSSFSAAVARTLAASAQVAVLLALLGILIYIWIRFGSLRYSVAAIVALVHDVVIALGVLALTAYLGRTFFGQLLLIDEFRIDLGVVAALLTIIGYSLNDTIVILDRVRENRGKLPVATESVINRSINQTVSRTVLTSFTTLLAILIMYIEGGSGIRSFAFCLLVGLVVGTYSSVAIAAPLVHGKRPPARETAASESASDASVVAAP